MAGADWQYPYACEVARLDFSTYIAFTHFRLRLYDRGAVFALSRIDEAMRSIVSKSKEIDSHASAGFEDVESREKTGAIQSERTLEESQAPVRPLDVRILHGICRPLTNASPAIHQLLIHIQLRLHCSCLVGVVRSHVPDRTLQWRPSVHALRIHLSYIWRHRSRLLVGRVGFNRPDCGSSVSLECQPCAFREAFLGLDAG
jgi:hypothetical protein